MERHNSIMMNAKRLKIVFVEYLVGHLPLGNKLSGKCTNHRLLMTNDKGYKAITTVGKNL
jgi:hypothetical protein